MDENTQNNPISAPISPTPTVEVPTVPVAASQDSRLSASKQGGFSNRGRGGFGGNRGRGGRPGGRGTRPQRPMEKPEFDQKTLDIARVARVTKGGKRFSFRATVVTGNAKGRVGVGIAKGRDVQSSIQKAYNQAKKNLVTVIIKDGTIPYQVNAKYSSASVILKPSKSGIKAGGAVRVVAQMAGISGLTGKLTGRTSNKINIARATIQALSLIRASKIS